VIPTSFHGAKEMIMRTCGKIPVKNKFYKKEKCPKLLEIFGQLICNNLTIFF